MKTSLIKAGETGIEAIHTLFQDQDECAFIIHHLNPIVKEGLALYINEQTTLKIGQNHAAVIVRPNTVYLIEEPQAFSFDGTLLNVSANQRGGLDANVSNHYLMEMSDELVCLHDPDGSFSYVSPASLKVTGYSSNELIGRSPYDFIHPDDQEYVRTNSHEAVLQGDDTSNTQYRFKKKSGGYVWLDTYTNAVKDQSGQITSIISGSRNFTDLKQAEIKLRESEERFRGLAANLPGVIYLCRNDATYSMLFLSDEVEYLTGYRAEEFLNGSMSFVDLYHPDDAEMIFKKVDMALSNQEAFHLTYRIRNKRKKDYLWVDEYGQGIYEGKSLKSIEGVILDTTDRRIAEERLKQSEANLKSIFESTTSLIGLFDLDQKLIEYNPAFSQHAKSANGIDLYRGIDLYKELGKERGQIFRDFNLRALGGEKFKTTLEYPTPKGMVHLLFTYNPIYQKNEITGVSMFVEDITELKNSQRELERYTENLESLVEERTHELQQINIELSRRNDDLAVALSELKEAQAQLVQAEKMASLGVLAAGIGHEINNPLNFIQNGTSGLKRELQEHEGVDWETIGPFFRIIEEGAIRAGNIVKSLSLFSRQVKDMDEPCHVHKVIDNCLVILSAKLKGRVEVVKNYIPSDVVVTGNEGKLHQIFLNILTNAEQAIAETGSISINTSVDRRHVLVEISDDGQGIPKENLSRIGDPFFTTKPPGVGTGLGLFITYSLIKELNGEIDVESSINTGTKFMIRFPIA